MLRVRGYKADLHEYEGTILLMDKRGATSTEPAYQGNYFKSDSRRYFPSVAALKESSRRLFSSDPLTIDKIRVRSLIIMFGVTVLSLSSPPQTSLSGAPARGW